MNDGIDVVVARRVPEQSAGRVLGPRRHRVGPYLAPGHRVLAARRAVVDGDGIGRFDGSVAGGHNHQVDGELDGDEVADQIGIHLEGPQETFAHAGDETRRSVEVVDPTGQRLFGRGRHDRRSHDANGQVAVLVLQQLLGQSFREAVHVRRITHQSITQYIFNIIFFIYYFLNIIFLNYFYYFNI